MPRVVRAHDREIAPRTQDVEAEEDTDFQGLLLSDHVLAGLRSAGFVRPSPIQLKAIPLAKCGFDVIAQAKSGTGKTIVFTVALLEFVNPAVAAIQGLVLAPTREIAVQIRDTICTVATATPQLVCHTFIGGLPIADDIRNAQRCHIAVGTPGRVKALIESESLPVDRVRIFVLDEADKLLEKNFTDQINYIYMALPQHKQMLVLSATYPADLAATLASYMRDPVHVRIDVENPSLEGVRQCYSVVPSHVLPHDVFQEKVARLLSILASLDFKQCIVFSNGRESAEELSATLTAHNWPSSFISSSQDQTHRLQAMSQLHAFRLRVLVSTDLTARGVDLELVDLVVNLDVPYDAETYLHRIGRSGRFGGQGLAISLVTEKELGALRRIWDVYHTTAEEWHVASPQNAENESAEERGSSDTTELAAESESGSPRQEEHLRNVHSQQIDHGDIAAAHRFYLTQHADCAVCREHYAKYV